MKEHKRKHLVSPYIYGLSCLVTLLSLVMMCIFLWIWFRSAKMFPEEEWFSLTSEYTICFIICIGLCLSLPILLIIAGYEAIGKVYILDDCLELQALFHRRCRIYYSDIKYLGIDYRILNFTRQFWIYFREDDFPPEGKNKHHPFRNYVFTKRIDHIDMRNIRVQFTQRVFDDLVYYLPTKLSKQLNRCYSVIRLYHEDDEEYDRYIKKNKKVRGK